MFQTKSISKAKQDHRFDSSRSPGRGPLNVQIGVGQVIKGKLRISFSSLLFWAIFVTGDLCKITPGIFN
jgi:hypothetical protein